VIAEYPALLSSIAPVSPLHVLTVAPFFPSLQNTTEGCFIAEPLNVVANYGVKNTIIAVSPWHRRGGQPVSEGASQFVQYPCLPGNPGLATAGYFLFRRLQPLVRTLHRQRKIDLIHAHSALPCGHAAGLISRALNIPFVLTVHGLDAFSTRQVPGVLGAWCQRSTKRVFRRAERVFCISGRVQERVQAGCPDARTTVIHNGVDSELFSPAMTAAGGNTVLCVGNLIASKGQDVLLRAFVEVRKAIPHAALQFIGEGPLEKNLRGLAHRLGIADAVRFEGRKHRESVASEMRHCAVFALPSSYEGLGCVYLEAMSCAKPVIGCRGQGIEEIIEHQRNGYLVEPGDHRALSETIVRLLQDRELGKEIGRRARATILQRYTLTHQAALMCLTYRESAA
jgi:teichuronic acid biosynthesis glycosyltransferase TuaC